MFDSIDKSLEKLETIQNIAIKLVEEQQILQQENGPKERAIFLLGSKGVGKSTVVNKFFDREEPSRPTLALEYSFGRRSSQPQNGQKQILNLWELGSLENSDQLLDVPMRSHGLDNLTIFLMVDLSLPNRLWTDLDMALTGLRKAYSRIASQKDVGRHKEQTWERLKNSQSEGDAVGLDPFPLPLVIVCGKYDIFMDFDPEIKKHVCRCLRSVSHILGAGLLFYSQKDSKLSKTLRDSISHFGFGSPSQPFRSLATDYNSPLTIWFGADSWEGIGISPISFEEVGRNYGLEIKQVKNTTGEIVREDPAKDPGFRESVIDEMRAQKDEELRVMMKDTGIRDKFETIIN